MNPTTGESPPCSGLSKLLKKYRPKKVTEDTPTKHSHTPIQPPPRELLQTPATHRKLRSVRAILWGLPGPYSCERRDGMDVRTDAHTMRPH